MSLPPRFEGLGIPIFSEYAQKEYKKKCLNELNRHQGASSWLNTIHLLKEGYDLTKQLFWDLICVRYGWKLIRLSSNYESGIKFDIQHALISCKETVKSIYTVKVDTVKSSLSVCNHSWNNYRVNIFNIQLKLVIKSDLRSVLVGSDRIFRCKGFQSKRQTTCKHRTRQSFWNQQKGEKETI